MYRSVMKTVSGPPQLCRAKVIQTVNQTTEMFFFLNMKRGELFLEFSVMSYYVVTLVVTLCVSFPVPEILCGDPPILPHTGQVWNGSSTPGSAVTYYCKIGFYHNEGNSISLCSINGYWTKPNISCKGNNLLQCVVNAVVGIA